MAPVSVRDIIDLAPAADPRIAEQHCARLDARYFDRFSAAEIARHVLLLSGLSRERPVSLDIRSLASGEVSCTVLSFDHPGAFALISGVLSSLGFDIRSGDIFTWSPARPDYPRELELRRRRIVDCFTGFIAPGESDEGWSGQVEERLLQISRGLERGADEAAAARRTVNEMAARSLRRLRQSGEPVLYPVQIEVSDRPTERTRMRVISQDTPFFLYTFSTALSLQEVSIEHVTIRTVGGRIEDEFEFVDDQGRAIVDAARIDRIKLSVLLTKQFTSFLESAPDPLTALLRFEQLVRDLVAAPQQEQWVRLLSDQGVMRDLAQILGASTFLWEDFVRLQYEALLPLLAPQMGSKAFSEPLEDLPARFAAAMAGADDPEEFVRRLNAFKDREIYLYDLDHILGARRAAESPRSAPGDTDADTFASDFLLLSRRLTALAELVADAAASHAWKTLSARHGEPRTVAGLPVRYALMGLGKLGGAALGYASDIELLLVYSDSGATAGPEAIENAEFFDKLVRELPRLVLAKREGIFHVDLRLRPYGAAGPLGCGLESFCTYYARGGPAHSYERLALVRLRVVGGDKAFGSQVERLRDEMIFSARRSIDLAELRELRARQAQEKIASRGPDVGRLNAKFSPGALVDLEYAVQILQVTHGAEEPRLRTPRIHEALAALASIGVVESAEAGELVAAYRFFRRLINGLRMLRGSAQDLLLPRLESDEFMHLARRMSYRAEPEITPAQKLHLDFETHTAAVRAFVERHFGRDSLPGAPVVTVADIVLSDGIPESRAHAALAAKGFSDPARALVNLRRIGGETEQRLLFARLAILACDLLAQRPDPDMALNNWERFLHVLPDANAHLRRMLSQPMRLEILLSIFSASQFLADTLEREPGLLDYIGDPQILHLPRGSEAIASELAGISRATPDRDDWRNALRRFRRREILRIGARDICLGASTQRIMEELSDLAEGVITASLQRIRAPARESPDGERVDRFAVIAFGKLGGRELNYSSDIDLLGVYTAAPGVEAEQSAARIMESLRSDLSLHTTEGYAYRVDLRLRPYGSAGQLVSTPSALADYYANHAALWELQALLKARPVGGDAEVGTEFLASVRPLLTAPHPHAGVASNIDRLRKSAMRASAASVLSTTDIKTGLGGLRDIEFLAQGLQLVHAHTDPALLRGGTLAALKALGEARILSSDVVDELCGDYLFMRRVEHFLQIYEDRQTHSLPRDPSQLRALARLMLGTGATAENLSRNLAERFERVQSAYQGFLQAEG